MSSLTNRNRLSYVKSFLICVLFNCLSYFSYTQPANDNCPNAEIINIASNGFSTGTFSSSNVNITQATVQSGETFASAIFVEGQNKKSIWFKFILPTTRAIRVTLLQSGAIIQAGEAGFAVYKTNTCLPDSANISTKLTPIATFGNTYHPCVDSGVYLVQVSSKATTSGLLSIQVEANYPTNTTYDRPTDAYAFGTLTAFTSHIDFSVECQSLDDASEVCPALSSYQQYTKSTWHTFKTPNYFDYLSVLLASPTGNFTGGQQVFGYQLYKGDARTTPVASLVLTDGCDSLVTTGFYPDKKVYKCGELEINTTYTIQLFYKQSFNLQNVRLAVAYGGVAPTKAPEPILSSMAVSNRLGVLAASPGGITTTATDYLACNSRHSIHPCGDALLANGIVFSGNRYNLSTFYTFTLSAASNINMAAYSSTCGNPALLLRLYSQDVTNNCATLLNTSLYASALTSLNGECLPAGNYTVQVLGRDTTSPQSNTNYGSIGSSSPLCLLSNLGQRVDFSIRVTLVEALNNYALQANDVYDKINALNALQNGVLYQAAPDTFGCSATVLPDTICNTALNKAMYRQFVVADSGLITLTNKTSPFLYKLYKGDANMLATQQNKHAYPDRITGMIPQSLCLDYYENCQPDKVCVLPGTYTFATFGGSSYVNIQDRPQVKLDLLTTTHYSPATAQDMGSILDSSAAARTSDTDYFSCTDNAVVINGYAPCTISDHVAKKAIYRQFYLRAPAVISISGSGGCTSGGSKTLFSGKATDGIAGLQPLANPWRCFGNAQTPQCQTLPAGWYTVVSYGTGPSYQNPMQDLDDVGYSSYVGLTDRFTITVTPTCAGPKYNRPYKAAIDMVTNLPFLVDWPSGRTAAPPRYLYPESFNCTLDTPFVSQIIPCNASLNRIAYYVFRTTRTTSLQIGFQPGYSVAYAVYARDVRTDSLLGAVTPILACTYSSTNSQLCNLPAGTYTLVVFAGDNLNCLSIMPVISRPCFEPWYNRPYKAAVDSVTSNPFVVDWGPRTGHTAAYPKTDTTYNLYTEYFDCNTDTPFSSHPVVSCNASVNRVAYYVFRVMRESYVQVNTQNLWGAVYALDVRTDSSLLATSTPVQPCLQSNGFIQLCRLPPGVYTLVVFAGNNNICSSVTPSVYIDQVGYSRFDHAKNAYDFGTVPPDSVWHNGKVGDVNPLNGLRAASNDFFYCTTGARQTDPANAVCNTVYNANIYNDTLRYLFNASTYTGSSARRNLWYTFVTNQGGAVRVRVNNKTIGKQYQYRYAVYKSNVDGTLPFSAVVNSGLVDSTVAQGLSFVTGNQHNFYCYNAPVEVSFYRDPCNNSTERYYILVENTNTSPFDLSGMQPNSQAEVSILIDSVNAIAPLFDHYSQAFDMGTVGAGTHTGATDNFSCATRDATDPVYASLPTCTKNLWYKFTNTITGNVRIRMTVGTFSDYNYDDIQLFRQMVPGDSTAKGLQYQSNMTIVFDSGFNWSQTCIVPGTYYLLLPGCNRLNEYVYPQIKILEQAGDFCSAPVVAPLNGPGAATSTVIVNCHTIGTDYGEFNPLLTCPANTPRDTYKSSWFRIDITGNDTLDVTAYLNESTTASSSQIKYRMMTGNCGAMQEQSCVQDALTQNTYKCLTPGSYYFQVFTPVSATGTIDLKLSAIKHADTCAPLNNCLANANFIPQFNCTTGDSVRFINYSTYGSAIQYTWNFGYNNQTSSAVSPSFFYPALPTAQTYTITLNTSNTGCGGQNTVIDSITIPGRPYINLGRDTALCNGGGLMLNATSHTGSTYQWSNGATTPTISVNSIGVNTYWVRVTYNGCIKRDTIKVFINPITGRRQSKVLCGNDSTQLSSYRGFGETYLWSNGSITNNIYANIPGTYYCDVTLNGCIKRDTFNVTGVMYPFTNDSIQACFRPGSPFILNATTPGAVSYSWQNGSSSPIFNITTTGLYWVIVNFGSCSVRDSVIVSNLQAARRVDSVAICTGQSFTLPSGTIVSTAGIYNDTARNTVGCDSSIARITVTIKPVIRTNSTAFTCQGQSLTLPWGTTVSAAGIYSDTTQSAIGCDSLIRSVTVSLYVPILTNVSPVICDGQSYPLPSGTVVSTPGIYKDTIHYAFGCDSLITTVNLQVKPVVNTTLNPAICSGQYYTLPSGAIVNVTGLYRDTLSYTSGCDSVRFTINLSIRTVNFAITNASICAGQNYTLPAGQVVSASGIYRDTVRYRNSTCDSLITTTTLSLKLITIINTSPSICAGQNYTLPSGNQVSTAGIYTGTLLYSSGCDSVIYTINLGINTSTNINLNAAICQGQIYALPWGTTVTTAGIYRNTLQGSTGCDSIVTSVTLAVTPRPAMGINPPTAIVCKGDNLQLKAYGGTAYRWIQGSGISSPTSATTFVYPLQPSNYRVVIYDSVCNLTDTFQSVIKVEPLPVINITKTNDITCMQGTTQLTASGGNRYIWSPANSLSNRGIYNPIATPSATTVYHVQAFSNRNCTTEDSVEVKVIKGDPGTGYFVPSAFTPNGDGKNDCFGISNWGAVTNLQFRIYDRWGMLVFSTTDPFKCWDGTFRGQPQATANFVYMIKGETLCGIVEHYGKVVLIR